jgi:L-ascorbate metabolism protein UlaG (beta-lactamase superfamily)
MKFTLAGKSFLHCGDLGHIPDKTVIEKLGRIDVLFVPIGGFYTIAADQAKQLHDLLSPGITFPMHYKTAVLNFPIANEEPFKKLFPQFRKIENNQLTLQKSDFAAEQVIFLNYAEKN